MDLKKLREITEKLQRSMLLKGIAYQVLDTFIKQQEKALIIDDVVVSLICDHPKDEREDYHDCSVVCNKCGCIIEQYGKEINPPSPL